MKITINITQATRQFSRGLKSKTVNQQVKNSVNGTQRTMLFYQERLRLKITQSKIPLTVQREDCFFSRKNKTENHPVKNSVNGTQGTMLFFQERVGLKIDQSKLVLTVDRVHCYFRKKE